MNIIIKKKPGLHQWDYPGDVSDFTDGFRNPENNDELVVTNKSGKTLQQLNDLSDYTIKEFNGNRVVQRGPERRINPERRE